MAKSNRSRNPALKTAPRKRRSKTRAGATKGRRGIPKAVGQTPESKGEPRHVTPKSKIVLELLKGPGGASLAEMNSATGWQTHSVRGFLSGTVKKRMGLALTSNKTDTGERRYRLEAGLKL